VPICGQPANHFRATMGRSNLGQDTDIRRLGWTPTSGESQGGAKVRVSLESRRPGRGPQSIALVLAAALIFSGCMLVRARKD
jgi:hypothetical protein